MIFNNARVLTANKSSLFYTNKQDIAPIRTFFSTPFDDMLKGKRREFSERKVLG